MVFKRKLLFAGCLIIAIGLGLAAFINNQNTARQPANGRTSTIKTISSKELNKLLNNKNFYLVNVHVPNEGEIAKTDAFIAYDAITSKAANLPKNKKQQIILYCKTGRMSRIAANSLVNSGFTNIYELEGGMEAWQDSGYELLQKGS